MNKILMIIISCFFLVGCSTISKDYRYLPESEHADKDGMVLVRRLEMNKPGLVERTPEGGMKMDSREPNLWGKYVQPILVSAKNNAQANVM